MTEQAAEVPQPEKIETPVRQIADSQPVRPTEDNETNSHSQNPNKLKKKRKKHKKHVHKPHRDPQEIKQIRLERLNIKREGRWNDRFANGTIPDIFASKPKKKKSQIHLKRQKSPIQTVYLDRQLIKNRLPHLKQRQKEKAPENTRNCQIDQDKSFNIRTVAAKRQVKKYRKAPAAIKVQQDDSMIPSLEGKFQSKVVEQPHDKPEDRFRARLEEKVKTHAVNQHYKNILTDLIQLYSTTKDKQLRTLLDHEISSIGHPKNIYTQIELMIQDRRKQIANIVKSGQSTTLSAYLAFQLSSVTLVEEILKFKAKWEEQYFKASRPCKLEYQLGTSNYLLEMVEEVKQLCGQDSDPFLVARTHKLQSLVGGTLKQEQQQQRRDILLKIRACELLLVEEELLEG